MLVVAKVVNHVQRLPSLSSSISKSLESERPHHDPTLSERPKRLVLRVMHIWHLSRIVFEKSDPLISCAPLSGLEYDLNTPWIFGYICRVGTCGGSSAPTDVDKHGACRGKETVWITDSPHSSNPYRAHPLNKLIRSCNASGKEG